jgi:iron complex outermembrane receptor protein
MSELFALTLGVRWAEDKKEAEENLYLYQESRSAFATCSANAGSDCASNLFTYNRDITGGVDPTGNVSNFDTVRFSGVPFSRSIYRSIENEFDDVTWRVNLDFTPTADDLFYASVTTGYRAGGFNLGYFSFIPTYEPEEITSYELGYKGQLFDGTLQINASTYYYDYENIHLQFSTSSFTGTSTSVQNAPSARTIGFEVDVIWLAADALTLGGTYSFTDAEYNEELFEPTTGQMGVLDDGNPYAPASVFSQAERNFGIDGEPLPRVPKHKFTGWAEYVLRLGDNGTVTFLTSVAYTDEFPAAGRPLPATPLVTAPDYTRWDARVGWASAAGQWNVSAFVNNITDEVGVRNQFVYSELEGHRRVVEPTNPRMYGLEVQFKFGEFR